MNRDPSEVASWIQQDILYAFATRGGAPHGTASPWQMAMSTVGRTLLAQAGISPSIVARAFPGRSNIIRRSLNILESRCILFAPATMCKVRVEFGDCEYTEEGWHPLVSNLRIANAHIPETIVSCCEGLRLSDLVEPPFEALATADPLILAIRNAPDGRSVSISLANAWSTLAPIPNDIMAGFGLDPQTDLGDIPWLTRDPIATFESMMSADRLAFILFTPEDKFFVKLGEERSRLAKGLPPLYEGGPLSRLIGESVI